MAILESCLHWQPSFGRLLLSEISIILSALLLVLVVVSSFGGTQLQSTSSSPAAAWTSPSAAASPLVRIVLPAHAAPFKPTDLYNPPCPGGLLPDTPATTFSLWSDVSTWPSGVVPGVAPNVGVNVTIPCGLAVLLDLPSVSVNVLNIRGLLRVQDSPLLPSISIAASFIIVEGQFSAGRAEQQFSRQLTITLMPNVPNARANFQFPVDFPGIPNPPADAAYPRNFGHKAFVVVGGRVALYGLPAPADVMLPYTKLIKTAPAGSTSITVEGDVTASWKVNKLIVLASTDYLPSQDEVVTITAVSVTAAGNSLISISKPLTFSHFGDPTGLSDGFGGFVDQRGEVALLQRNIVVTGLDEAAPFELEGGHFMIFHTETPQVIQGVEFFRMGQQGVLGRYNIHFHLAGKHGSDTVVSMNVMRDSKQRCLVLHTTFGVQALYNVAHNTFGHCFVVEEGGETNNSFIGNLGIRTKTALKVIPPSTSALAGTIKETDDFPATFWITNPSNDYLKNIAAGSDGSGFWFELRMTVRGNTVDHPNYNKTIPFYTPLARFESNVAHSNRNAGLRLYPHGFRPRVGGFIGNPNIWNLPKLPADIKGMVSWKNPTEGIFVHQVDSVTFSNATLSDNRYGINIDGDQAVTVSNSLFVGQTNNLGNPTNCNPTPANGGWVTGYLCGPVAPSCTFPIPPGQPARSQGWNFWSNPIAGVIFDHENVNDDDKVPGPHKIINNRFSFYNPLPCRPASAITIGFNNNPQHWWGAGHSSSGLILAPGSSPIMFPSRNFAYGDNSKFYGGEVAELYSWHDKDGSMVGGSFGFAIANNTRLLPPPSLGSCSAQPQWPGFACPNVCYRTVHIKFVEPGFAAAPGNKLGDFSYLVIRRLEDGVQLTVEGNLVWEYSAGTTRNFIFPLAAGPNVVYEVNVVPPAGNPSFFPTDFSVQYRDGPSPCLQPVTLRFVSDFAFVAPDQSSTFSYSPCKGASKTTPVTFSEVCHKSKATFQLSIDGAYSKAVQIFRSGPAQPCQLTALCGVLPGSQTWQYDTSGGNLRPPSILPPAFTSPLFNAASWPSGQAPFGWSSWGWNIINTITRQGTPNFVTSYFRSSFKLSDTSCITGLYFDAFFMDGFILYVNSVEALRVNMPSGPISNSTSALKRNYPPSRNFVTYFVPVNASSAFQLVDGTNYLAAELHICSGCYDSMFDIRVWANRSLSGCGGPAIRPEVCDGVDNDSDGKVDISPISGNLLQQPCSTACGSGLEVCLAGSFQGCSAKKPQQEICNGIDDDCDGMVDNGPSPQLDCPSGLLCYSGQCLPAGNLSKPVAVVSRTAPDWFFIDSGVDVPSLYPNWTTAGNLPLTAPTPLKKGPAALGYAGSALFPSTLLPLPSSSATYYFLKPFNLSAAQIANTYAITASVRRDDGAVLYVNGIEIFRSNILPGPVSFTTLAQDSWGQETTFFPSPLVRSSKAALKPGTNWFAAELHQSSSSGFRDAVFDADLTRLDILPCPSGPCVRPAPSEQSLLAVGSSWKYLDASMPLPPSSWTKANFDDSTWPTGVAPLGVGSWSEIKTKIVGGVAAANGRIAYYFRTSINIPDGGCYLSSTVNLRQADGAVVYVNGVELFRVNMPNDPTQAIQPTTLGTVWNSATNSKKVSSGGWLKQGINTIAVEVHHGLSIGSIVFDLSVTGLREGVNCPIP